MITNELMLMISKFLYGEYDPNDFSFDFPDALCDKYDELSKENNSLAKCLNKELPELCSWFDPHNTGDDGTIDEKEFKEKVMEIYIKALPLARPTVNLKKIS